MSAEPLRKPLQDSEEDPKPQAQKIPARKRHGGTWYDDDHNVGSLLDAFLAARKPMDTRQ